MPWKFSITACIFLFIIVVFALLNPFTEAKPPKEEDQGLISPPVFSRQFVCSIANSTDHQIFAKVFRINPDGTEEQYWDGNVEAGLAISAVWPWDDRPVVTMCKVAWEGQPGDFNGTICNIEGTEGNPFGCVPFW